MENISIYNIYNSEVNLNIVYNNYILITSNKWMLISIKRDAFRRTIDNRTLLDKEMQSNEVILFIMKHPSSHIQDVLWRTAAIYMRKTIF